MITFSRRLQEDIINALTEALDEARRAATPIVDLTQNNPTRVGLPYPREHILRALSDPNALVYEPAPLGLASARAAVSAHYARRGLSVDSANIALTASTSEAYAVLFKLFCDPGDEVLVPQPSYPLLEWLAALEGVTLRSYPLVFAGQWHVDLAAVRAQLSPRTKLIVVVSPNHPTGSYLGRDEFDALVELGLPIACDEVFATYPLFRPSDRIESAASATRGLVLALSGLSKAVGLPQLKLGWIACAGDPFLRAECIKKLELVMDAYLSVGAPVQHALGTLLLEGELTTKAILDRVKANHATLCAIMATVPMVSVLPVEGGWVATLRIPETFTDEAWALMLLKEAHVRVDPGFFFDISQGAHWVLSLLTPPLEFAEGVRRIADFFLSPGRF